MSKASDLRGKDVAGLEKEVNDLLKAHFGLRMQKAEMGLQEISHLFFEARYILGAEIRCFAHDLPRVHAPSWRETNVQRSGSLAAASVNASRASASGTPFSSYSTLPGTISAT